MVEIRQESVLGAFLTALGEVLRNVLQVLLKVNRRVVMEAIIIQDEEEGVEGAPAIRLCLEPLLSARPENLHRVGQSIEPSCYTHHDHATLTSSSLIDSFISFAHLYHNFFL
jgi:hypothetical protein